MAQRYNVDQSSLEEKVYTLSYNLLSGVTLTNVTLTHTPPSGQAASVTLDGAISSPVANVAVPSGLVVGEHYVSCVGVTSDAKFSPEILLVITVKR